ncbi:MAG TPA: Ig-like domain-containing protein [Myxococcaceae bacterium]|nr:Ig-like domain-containing protein [Myxococcaceae bacterium]
MLAASSEASPARSAANLNNPPTAVDDTLTVAEDSGPTAVNVLGNDTTSDAGETLTVTDATLPPRGGSIALRDGAVFFTPAPNFNGADTFSYTISDGNGATATATVTVTVTPVNDPPTAANDTLTVAEDAPTTPLPVLANDSSAPDSGETLTVTDVDQVAEGGTVSLKGGEILFTPVPNFHDTVTFEYTVSDGNGGTATATVTLTVAPVNDPPSGVADTFRVPSNGGPFPLAVLANDSSDPEDGETLTVSAVTQPAGGLVSIGTDGANVMFTPAPGVVGTVTFTYTVSDGNGGTATVTVTVNVGSLDSDGDGLSDDDEAERETDPDNRDTDGGGVSDGDEVAAGRDPRNYADDLATAGHGCASTGTGPLLPLVLLGALALHRRRLAPRGRAKAWGLLGLLAAVLLPAPARAQHAAEASQGIDVQQFKPGPGWSDVLGVQSPRVARHLGWNLGLSFNYARDPLNFLRFQTSEFSYAIVEDQYTFDLMGAVALYDRFELGLVLPITSHGSAAAPFESPVLASGVNATRLGDVRLVPKAQLLSLENGARLGVAASLLLPTSGGDGFLGREGVAFFPRLLVEWAGDSGVRVLAHLGLNLQPRARFYNLNVGTELAYGLGASVPFQVGTRQLLAEATLVGARGLTEWNLEERPLELLAAVKYRFTDSLAAHLGGGQGLTRGYGTPDFRLLAGISWTQQAGEAAPARPEPREEKDDFQDPEPSPNEWPRPEGWPPSMDERPRRDERPRPDERPRTQEPPPTDEPPRPRRLDSDGDGVPNDKDLCPQYPEDKDGFEDEDGCSDPDNDKDGVLDAVDRCLTEPETHNGYKDQDGCPDTGKPGGRVRGLEQLRPCGPGIPKCCGMPGSGSLWTSAWPSAPGRVAPPPHRRRAPEAQEPCSGV